MLVGLFEPVGAPWSLDGVPRTFSFGKLPPDWERMEPYLARAMSRIPSLAETGVRTFFCGPESFTADVRPLLGPAPELDGYFVAAGLNSLGILSGGGVGTMLAHWIVDGVPPVDATPVAIDRTATTRPRAGSGPSAPWSSLACCSATRCGRPGSPRPAGTCAARCCTTGWPAPARHFGASAGWEFPEWFAEPGEHPATSAGLRPAGLARARRPRARHGTRGRRRAGHEPDGEADRAGAGRRRGAVPAVGQRRRPAQAGRIVYTQWLNTAGGIIADLTVTRLEEEQVPGGGQRHHPPPDRAADQAGDQARTRSSR